MCFHCGIHYVLPLLHFCDFENEENLLKLTVNKACYKSPCFMSSRIVVLNYLPLTPLSIKGALGTNFKNLTKN